MMMLGQTWLENLKCSLFFIVNLKMSVKMIFMFILVRAMCILYTLLQCICISMLFCCCLSVVWGT